MCPQAKTGDFCVGVKKDSDGTLSDTTPGNHLTVSGFSCAKAHPHNSHRLARADGMRENRVWGASGFFGTQKSEGGKRFSRSPKSLLFSLL